MSLHGVFRFSILASLLFGTVAGTARAQEVEFILERITCQAINDNVGNDEIYFIYEIDSADKTAAGRGPGPSTGADGENNTVWSLNNGLKSQKELNRPIFRFPAKRGVTTHVTFGLMENDGADLKKAIKAAGSLGELAKDPRAAGAGKVVEAFSDLIPDDGEDIMGVFLVDVKNKDGELELWYRGGDYVEVDSSSPKKPVVKFANDDGKYTAYFTLRLVEDNGADPKEPSDMPKPVKPSTGPKPVKPATPGVIDLATMSGKQKALIALGYELGRADGLDGPKTQAAARKFQADHGLGGDGKIGPKTTAKLRELLEEKGIPFKN